MSLRKAASYTKKKVVPYTRVSKRKEKSYIKSVPPQKIVKFVMGNNEAYTNGKFPYELTLFAEENAQIRSNAIEACRQYIHKELEENLAGQYFFRVIPYPHHVQRENKMLTGAGSDRMQTGMQLSFGKPILRAAIVKTGEKIFFIALPNDKALKLARSLVEKIRSKLPCKTRIITEMKKQETGSTSSLTPITGL